MSKGLKFSPLLIAAVLCIGLVVYLYLPKDVSQQVNQASVTFVKVHRTAEEDFEVVVEALGTGKANESVFITTQTSDIVQKIHFDDGDLVKQGQLLLELNDTEEKAKLTALDVNLQEALRQLNRITNLAKNNVASEQLLDEQQAKVNVLKAEMDVAKTQLDELFVRTPFDGVLGVRQISVGALVTPGDVITTLDDLSIIKVDFDIAESHLASVALGQLVRATSIAYPDQIFEGKITSIASRVNASTRSVQIRANIKNQDLKLRPGMLLQILLQKQVLKTLVLPEIVLVPAEDKQFVFVVKDNQVELVEVKVGLRKPGKVQILSGLQVGDVVVTEGTLKLRSGSKVTFDTANSEE
ncbi:efflux RND transporter periplasmic adaptor subunit [Paraglaciecola arctica]|uniref:HlyD family secretion protein n=1 Tax=Paraglaciecola arctica BSs20135 TaxID=493475 RepID=K6YC20_9ALTE|nr:efflux RND transporter periplasmic adaptor subunit [Paraglaciecola arctica]GAC21496.1 HlyD family secretion protein [Paraglaciecola arctica BSs20135]